MIKIFRTRDMAIVGKLTPHLIFPNPAHQAPFLQQLAEGLANYPDRIYICVAVDDEELVGFIIAQSTPEGVWIAQAWNSGAWKVIEELYSRIILWAVALGHTTISAQTNRSTEALYRRFGFEETAKLVTAQVPENLIPRIMSAIKETQNG